MLQPNLFHIPFDEGIQPKGDHATRSTVTVETTFGTVLGSLGTDFNVKSFYTIPFAEPPTGKHSTIS